MTRLQQRGGAVAEGEGAGGLLATTGTGSRLLECSFEETTAGSRSKVPGCLLLFYENLAFLAWPYFLFFTGRARSIRAVYVFRCVQACLIRVVQSHAVPPSKAIDLVY
jgi:hypothetical protein